jgi:MFS transporter, FSR family, fosmidomycin resistance protein
MQQNSARLSLGFSCLGHAYMHMFTAFYFVIVLSLEEVWQRPYHELIQLWTLGSLLVGLAALPAGWLGDRLGAANMMTVFFVGLGLAGIASGLVEGPDALFLGLTAIGVFSAIYHPVGIAWVVRSAKSRGKALGVNGVFGSIGIASAGIAAGGLIDAFGWRAAFIVPGVVCLLTGVVLWICVRLGLVSDGVAAKRKAKPESRGDMLRAVAILLLTMAIMGILFQATQAAIPKLFDIRLRDIAGEGTFGIGLIVAGVYTVAGVTQLVGGYLADKFPLKPIYLLSFLFQTLAMAAVASLGSLPLVAMTAVVVLLSVVALPAENMMLARYTPERHHSLVYGVKFVLAFGTAPLSIMLVSRIQEQTGEFVWLFLALAAMASLGSLAAFLLPGEWRRARTMPVAAE